MKLSLRFIFKFSDNSYKEANLHFDKLQKFFDMTDIRSNFLMFGNFKMGKTLNDDFETVKFSKLSISKRDFYAIYDRKAQPTIDNDLMFGNRLVLSLKLKEKSIE